ncbi:hypothetical protein PRIC1_000034 [Phytophthora ramorum]
MAWGEDELLRLIQAWQECLEAKAKGGKAKKKKTTAVQFSKRVLERFEELSGGSSHHKLNAVMTRKDILQNSYVYIRSFRGDPDTNGGVEWFALPTSDQRALMKTAGGQHVQPMGEGVFLALDAFLGKELAATEESEAESESSQTTETDGRSSEGDKYEKVVRQKKKVATVKKAKKPRNASRSRREAQDNSGLEEDSGEILSPKEEGRTKAKRRRVAAPKKTPSPDLNVNVILERQSQVLAEFLDKRAEERTREHERSQQERDADQKFWAVETAKDRALLRELFTEE